jgi:excisionase family DNA binding protein
MTRPAYDTTIFTRCLHCGYLTSHCHCPPNQPTATPPAPPAGQLPELMTPAEVGALFRVDPKTVTRWAQQGKLRSIRTLGGHRRYAAADVQAFLNPSRQ